MKNELLKGLTEEQIKKASECKSHEELLAYAKAEGIELSDEQLEAISGGGFCSDSTITTVEGTCPKCGAKASGKKYYESLGLGHYYGEYKCPKCGHKWTEVL